MRGRGRHQATWSAPHQNLLPSEDKERFRELMREYIKSNYVFSTAPLLNKLKLTNRYLKTLDCYFCDEVINWGKEVCINNIYESWSSKLLTDRQTIRYLRDNSASFCEFENNFGKHYDTKKSTMLMYFFKGHALFTILVKIFDSGKAYSVSDILKELGHDYKETIRTATLVNEWWKTVDNVHDWGCENVDSYCIDLLHFAKNPQKERLFYRVFDEYDEWRLIKKNKHKITPPEIPENKKQNFLTIRIIQ